MQHIVYAASADTFPIAILVKASAFNGHQLDGAIVEPLEQRGVDRNELILVSLKYNDADKAPVKFIKEYLEELLPALDSVGTQTLYCADANYFKVLTKSSKASAQLGYVLPCTIKGYEHFDVILGINYKALLHHPGNEAKLELSLDTLAEYHQGNYAGLGNNIIKSAQYLSDPAEVEAALFMLLEKPQLACDIETFSLRFEEAGIATIGFAWNCHEGIVIQCDYAELAVPTEGEYGTQQTNLGIQRLLREFFEAYSGELRFFKADFDVKILIYNLWMKDLLDVPGLLQGLEIMTSNWQDTRLLAYLALNSTAGNELNLKELAHAFAGNYAQADIKDIKRIPLKNLMEYNLIDCLSTNHVHEKYLPEVIKDNQLELYSEIFMTSQKTIVQIELTGMPLSPEKVQTAKVTLVDIVTEQDQLLQQSPVIQQLNLVLQKEAQQAANAKLKVKQHPLSKFADVTFNPGSPKQLQKLLFDTMKLPVLQRTKTRQPSTDGDTLEALLNHTEDPDYLTVLKALNTRSSANKILTAFIPAFEAAIDKGQGVTWLHGNFNLGGTISGRLSSSDPNLQQIPANSIHAKLIKQCFSAPKGWLFCGADFSSLEDRINALVTKDPNKLKVYIDGFDGHCLRTFYYWPEEFSALQEIPEDINSIATTHKKWRQNSKAPTFALTYAGTWKTLVKNCGFSKQEAQAIEARYHQLYASSDAWTQARIKQAAVQGFGIGAFGLRIRTPLLKQTILGHRTTPHEAEAEARSLGNAISGQSYGLLTNRAMTAVMERVWASEFRYQILPVAMIHDANYFVVRDDADVVAWLNLVLIEEMGWQKLPEIQHNVVKLTAELSLFYPSWADEIVIPNTASAEAILKICEDTMNLRELQTIEIGSKVIWEDPDEGIGSGVYTVVEILNRDHVVEDFDTVLVIEAPSGTAAEVFVSELAGIVAEEEEAAA